MPSIDTHCHLDFDQYGEDREQVIRECAERMAAVVNVGTNAERNQASLELARDHRVVHATMGLHPTYIKDLSSEPAGSTSDEVDRIVEQIRDHQR